MSPKHASWVSPASRQFFADLAAQPPAPVGNVEAQRSHYDLINTRRLERARQRYAVDVQSASLGGIVVHEVLPAQPGEGVLVCLHGGAFLWGAGAGAVLEAVPVAATTGLRVVAVEYRLAPEHVFPAAVDDVLSVIKALRLQCIGKIGLYGCSAGAALTAQVTARLIEENQAPPAAIAMLHGSGMEVGGDSLALAAHLNGTPNAADIQRLHDLPYYAGSDPSDPRVFSGDHPRVLSAFPPSLLITGSRDFAASSSAVMHRRLVAAGVDARFFLFDGMWHAHHVDVELPESQELYDIMASFFRQHLGNR